MAQGDRPAVHVRDLGSEAEFPHDDQRLDGEGLVQLDQADLLDPDAGPLERLPGRGDRTESHRPRLDPGRRGGDDAHERREAELPRLAIAHQEDRRGPVVDPARIACRDRPALAERGAELRERLQGRVGPRRLVPRYRARLPRRRRQRHRDDLFRELPRPRPRPRPATNTSPSSALIARASALIAARPEAQRRLNVTPATETGSPARRAAIRATFRLSSPAWFAQPRYTSSTSAGSRPAR